MYKKGNAYRFGNADTIHNKNLFEIGNEFIYPNKNAQHML